MIAYKSHRAYNWGFRVLKTHVPKSSEHQLVLYGFRNSTLSPTLRCYPRWLLCPWTKWRAIVDNQGHGGWWGGCPSSRVMEEGGVLGGRAPESQAPPSHFSHCSVSDVLLYGDSTGVWSTRWVLQSTDACTHTGLQSSISGPVRWAGRNWWIPLESLSRLPAMRGCSGFPSRAQNPSGSLFVQPSAPRSPLAWEPLLAPGPPPVHMECLLTQPWS